MIKHQNIPKTIVKKKQTNKQTVKILGRSRERNIIIFFEA